MPETKVKGERYYRPELDVLRLMAFLLVFFTHRMDLVPIDSTRHPWLFNLSLIGVFGVPVFFLLSAFLITELLIREREQTGRTHVKAFYIRRMLRIWPLYFLVFFGLVLLTRFVPGAGSTAPASWLAFTFFAGNWYISLHGWFHAYPVNPLWSISVEEQFYIAAPLICFFWYRRGLAIVSLTLLVIAYPLVAWYAMHFTGKFSSQWTNSFVQFQFFAAGTLLALWLKGRTPQWNLATRLSGVAAAIACWLIAFVKFGVQADNPTTTVAGALLGWPFVLAGAVLLFLSLLGISAKLLPRPLVYLGRISYGLYLFHALFLFLAFNVWHLGVMRLSLALNAGYWHNTVATVLALASTIVVAMLSYNFFERPFLRFKRRFTFVPSRD